MTAEVVRTKIGDAADARLLLNEYYEEVGVLDRDSPDDVRRFLSDADSGFWIAYVGEAPAGCVALRPLSRFPAAAECKRLYVRNAFRRRGIAETLLQALENHARDLSLSWVYLDSEEQLKAAISLYRARGYEHCERYNDSLQATVFMRKCLE